MMIETATTWHGARRKLSALLATALLASVLVITSPPPAAEADWSGGCSAVAAHNHGNWSYRARATHLSGSGQTLITWERRWASTANPWRYFNSHTC